jgi:hypothetical protein
MSFMISHTSALALQASDDSRFVSACDTSDLEGLQAIESTSILGHHDGVLDDDLFDLLIENAA